MGIDLGSLAPVAGKGGLLDLGGTFVGAINNIVKGIGYFAGGDLQTAIANGFMKV
ncbi:hypothetical protein [Dietzia sp. B32]|uniref:hypothetical protein n=1 Tax=Dietzia sp. B32 TaxID=2915130 RepID=UPI0021ADC340|nr:hypothetical protein [Dietzia sp. B32]UVE96576.1 hypothetical protein L8M95_07385 [Dietzia sp. B32]